MMLRHIIGRERTLYWRFRRRELEAVRGRQARLGILLNLPPEESSEVAAP